MATILINGVYHTSFREGGGGAAGMDILELSTATGTLTSAQLALVQSDHCIIKYSNNYYYKSYYSTNGCDYVRGTFTKTNASVTDYYFTCDFSNSEFTFGSNADERARVVANPTLGSGESATPLQNIRVAGTAYSIPAISTDVLADKTSNTKTASPKAVYDAVMALAGNESYVTAWDGESAPVAANIPAGVSVTYSGQTTTGSLAASENTDGKIYLVSDTNGNFYRYITQLNGSTYSWVLRGTTELDLSGYVTDEEFSQLDQEVNQTQSTRTFTGDDCTTLNYGISATTGAAASKANWLSSDFIAITEKKLVLTVANRANSYGIAFYSASSESAFISGIIYAEQSSAEYDIPQNATYFRFCYYFGNAVSVVLHGDTLRSKVNGLESDVVDLAQDVTGIEKALSVKSGVWDGKAIVKATDYVLGLGASFMRGNAAGAGNNNSWLFTMCEKIGVGCYNDALGGTNICYHANRLYAGTILGTGDAPIANVAAILIMHAHNKDVFTLPDTYAAYSAADYENNNIVPFAETTGDSQDDVVYAQAYDYVIKKIKALYAAAVTSQEYVASVQAYMGTYVPKPCQIVLCTYWHDARTVYNASVRKLAAKWGIPLVRFDDKIGFTKDQPNPVTGYQASIEFVGNIDGGYPLESIDGVAYGWHPMCGSADVYIQRKMASIAAESFDLV